MELRLIAVSLGERRAGTQLLRFAVVQLAHFLGHDVCKDKICRFQNLCARAEIAGKQQLAALPLRSLFRFGKGVVVREENAGIGKAEAINALLDIADGKEVFAVLRDRVKDAVLHLIGVLIFVHHDLTVALRNGARKLGRPAVFIRQQADRLMLLVGEVGRVAAAFLALIGAGKVRRQIQKRQHRRRHCAKIVDRFGARRVKIAQHVPQRRLAAFPKVLHALLHRAAVRVLDGGKARKHDAHAARPVPRNLRGGGKRVKLSAHLQKQRRILLIQRIVALHLLRRVLQKPRPVPRLAPHLVKQDSAVGRVLHMLRQLFPSLTLSGKPLFRIRLRLKLRIKLQHQLGKPAVVAPRAEGIGKQRSAVAVCERIVKSVEHTAERAPAQQLGIRLVKHAKVRTQGVPVLILAEQMAVFTQKARAEGIHRLNVRTVHAQHLALQTRVRRIVFQPFGERPGNFAAQLRRGGAGIGDNQKVIEVGAVPFDIGEQALNKHLRLAGAGCRGDQQASAAVFHRRALLLC